MGVAEAFVEEEVKTCVFNPNQRLYADPERTEFITLTGEDDKPIPEEQQPTLGTAILAALGSRWYRTPQEQQRAWWLVMRITDAMDKQEEYRGGTVATPLLQAAVTRFNEMMLKDDPMNAWHPLVYQQVAEAVGIKLETLEDLDALDAT